MGVENKILKQISVLGTSLFYTVLRKNIILIYRYRNNYWYLIKRGLDALTVTTGTGIVQYFIGAWPVHHPLLFGMASTVLAAAGSAVIAFPLSARA